MPMIVVVPDKLMHKIFDDAAGNLEVIFMAASVAKQAKADGQWDDLETAAADYPCDAPEDFSASLVWDSDHEIFHSAEELREDRNENSDNEDDEEGDGEQDDVPEVDED